MATNEPKLGELISGDAARDAIHIAVAPVVANEKLSPGQDIGFVGDDSLRVGACDSPIGIVDPFLKRQVFPEQKFWMFLYPKTITSLRHDWTHPAFEAPVSAKGESEKWMREFAEKAGLSPAAVLEHANDFLDHGDPVCQYDSESWRNAYYDAGPDFWTHFHNLTGRELPEPDPGSPFTCSC